MMQLLAAAAFLLVLGGVSAAVIHSFISAPRQTIVLPPDMAKLARAAIAPRVAQDIVRAAPNGTGPTFKGNVVDAQTHQPIENFTLRIGYKYQGDSNKFPYYNGQPKQFHGGKYIMNAQFSIGTQGTLFVRIDAPGHLPLLSPPQKGAGEVDFQLQPGRDIQGVVLDAGGSPVGGITVFMAVPGLEVEFDPATLQSFNGATKVMSGPDGRFTFPPQTGHITLLAMSDKGFAQVTEDADKLPAAAIEMRVAAWCRIKGHMTIATKPGANERLEAEGGLQSDQNSPVVYADTEMNCDANGNFHFDRVIPGSTRVSRLIIRKYGNRGTQGRDTMSVTVVTEPGKTTTVQLGGVGRAVVGKLVFPPGANINNYYINDNINYQAPPPAPQPPPQMPDKVKNGTPMARDLWMQFFGLTYAGRQWLAAHPPPPPEFRQYAMDISKDGKFRIEDVLPGDYHASLYPSQMQAGTPLMQVNLDFTVPPVPGGGYSDQPVVLPDVKFTARGQ